MQILGWSAGNTQHLGSDRNIYILFPLGFIL